MDAPGETADVSIEQTSAHADAKHAESSDVAVTTSPPPRPRGRPTRAAFGTTAASQETTRFFEEMAKHVTDDFWRDQLLSCSAGVFPRGVRFESGTKSLSIRPATAAMYEYVNLSSGPKIGAERCIRAFQDCLHMYSPSDRDMIDEVDEDAFDPVGVNEWKALKQKVMREKAISDFLARFNATGEETRCLTRKLQMYMALKHIRNDEIIIKDGVIQEIEGVVISRDPATAQLEIELVQDAADDTSRVAPARPRISRAFTQAIVRHSKTHKKA